MQDVDAASCGVRPDPPVVRAPNVSETSSASTAKHSNSNAGVCKQISTACRDDAPQIDGLASAVRKNPSFDRIATLRTPQIERDEHGRDERE